MNVISYDRDDKFGVLPIHSAASSEYAKIDVFKFLLSHGASVDSKTREGDTSLMLRAHNSAYYQYDKHKKIIEAKQQVIAFLLKMGADINAKNLKGETVLHYSLIEQDYSTAQYLVDNGADVNMLNKYKKYDLLQNINFSKP